MTKNSYSSLSQRLPHSRFNDTTSKTRVWNIERGGEGEGGNSGRVRQLFRAHPDEPVKKKNKKRNPWYKSTARNSLRIP